MRGRLAVAAVLAGSLIAGGAAQVLAHDVKLVGRLSGAAEVPGPGDPDGRGRAVIRVNEEKGKVCYNLTYSGIGEPNGAHIHKARRGEAGDAVIELFGGPTASPASDCIMMDDDLLLNRLQRRPGGYYVNIHNDEFPGGALRAQLRKPQ